MKKVTSKKLQIRTETLRTLEAENATAVVGGVSLHTLALNCVTQSSNC